MNYAKGILSGFAAIVIAEIVCSWLFFHGANAIGNSKAIGVAALVGVSVENLLSPLFWIIAGLLFWLFFAASRSRTILRVSFFWIPTLAVSTLAFAFVGLLIFLSMHFRNQ